MFSFVVVRVNIACAPNRALDVEDADVEKHRKTTADKCCALSGATAGVVHFVEVQSSLLRLWPLAAVFRPRSLVALQRCRGRRPQMTKTSCKNSDRLLAASHGV
jgi:hypothetical protein